jgi:UrcA family protein
MNSTLKTLIAAATLIAAFATGAQAAVAPQMHVRYADLNVHSAADVAVLNRRINAAADPVCGGAADGDLARRARVDACKAHAIAEALATVKAADVQLASRK